MTDGTVIRTDLGKRLDGQPIEPAALVAAARQFLGTPFIHQGRCPGVGLDCLGLLTQTAQLCHVAYEDNVTYSRRPKGRDLADAIAKHARLVGHVSANPMDTQACRTGEELIQRSKLGDLLMFWMRDTTRHPQHMGIRSDVGVIHTSGLGGVDRVTESGLGTYWIERLVAIYRIHGVAD